MDAARTMPIAFKEWTLICDALRRGEQSIILRKGGIAEGRAGFRFQHPEFYLFPTLFHEQVAKLKLPPETPLPVAQEGRLIVLDTLIRVEWTEELSDLDRIRTLAPYHLWRDSEIEKRYHYDTPQGVSLAFVRSYRLDSPITFPDSPKFGGCRSWITLPDFSLSKYTPAISDSTHEKRQTALRNLAG